MAQKTKVEPDMATCGTMVYCTSFNQNFTLATTIYLPGRIRPASKTALKRHKKTKVEPDMATYWYYGMLYKF